MKAILTERPDNKKRIILSNIDLGKWGDTLVKVIFDNELGWCVKYRFASRLTSVELRAIANKLDEYNGGKK